MKGRGRERWGEEGERKERMIKRREREREMGEERKRRERERE